MHQMKPAALHVHPLVRQLFEILAERKMPMDRVNNMAGFGHHTLHRWRTRYAPNLPNFDAALNVLGLELCIREIPDQPESPCRETKVDPRSRFAGADGMQAST